MTASLIRNYRGTVLIVFAIDQGIFMVADDLLCVQEGNKAVPVASDVRKVFAFGNTLIGSAGLLCVKDHLERISGSGTADTIRLEYDIREWVVDLIREHQGTPTRRPSEIASVVFEKMRDTLKPVEIFLESGYWRQNPGDRLLSFVVAGYNANFKNFELLELGAEIKPDGRGLQYVTPFRHMNHFPQNLYFGEDIHQLRAVNGIEPEAGVLRRLTPVLFDSVRAALPTIPMALQECVANAVALIRVEAEFNSTKVGRAVKAVIIDRAAKKQFLSNF